MPGFESATQAFPFPSTEIFFFPAGQVFSCFTCCCDSWERGRCSVFCFYLCLHTFNWFCLIMQRCVRQSSCKPHFFHVEFEFSFNFEFVFPCINERYFLLPLSYQHYPCPIFRFACRQLLLSVMFVLF